MVIVHPSTFAENKIDELIGNIKKILKIKSLKHTKIFKDDFLICVQADAPVFVSSAIGLLFGIKKIVIAKKIKSNFKTIVSEIGNISDRRIYLLLEGLHGLPAMLCEKPGLNSGLMVTQYTTAALVSENKALCFPVSSDSIPTGMGQEDHVSMGSVSGIKLLQVINNLEKIIALELLNASQALEFRRPNNFSPIIESSLSLIRKHVKKLELDRLLNHDIEKVIELVKNKMIKTSVNL